MSTRIPDRNVRAPAASHRSLSRACQPVRASGRGRSIHRWILASIVAGLLCFAMAGCANVVRGTHLYAESHDMNYDMRSGQRGLEGDGYTLGVMFDLAALLPPEPRPVYTVPTPPQPATRRHQYLEADPCCVKCGRAQSVSGEDEECPQ